MNFVFYTPDIGPPWDYTAIESGIGGSETYHIEMALRLARRGHNVISYNNTPWREDAICNRPRHRVFGGVEWRDGSQIDFRLPGVWVIQRTPPFIEKFAKRNDQRFWHVFHDFDYNTATAETCSKYTRLISLCKSHAEFLTATKAPAKVTASGSGIPVDRIEKMIAEHGVPPRNPHRLIYSSTPERGLEALIKNFLRAKEVIADLELHCYYGWEGFDQRAPHDKSGEMNRMKKSIEKLSTQPGITWHGRVGQPELWSGFLQSGIWCYPTQFFEVFCITAAEAQALGAIPITAPIYALRDNVMAGILLHGNCWQDRLVCCRFTHEIVRMAAAVEVQEKIRQEMMVEARRRFDYERIVDQFEEMAEEDLAPPASRRGLTLVPDQVEQEEVAQ